MHVEGIIEAMPITATDTNSPRYKITITGIGSMAECNYVMDLLMFYGEDTGEEE